MSNRTDFAKLLDEVAEGYGMSSALRGRIETELHNAFVAGKHALLAGKHALHQLLDEENAKAATERLKREHAETVGIALERRMRNDIAAVAEGLAAGFARAVVQPTPEHGRRHEMAEQHPALVTQAALVLRHEWDATDSGDESECPECGGMRPVAEDESRPQRMRGHIGRCAWGLLCEQLRHPVITGFIGMGMNFLMGERAEAGALVTFDDKGHLVPRPKP